MVAMTFILSGCETTKIIPYKASTANVIAIQQSLQIQDKKASIAEPMLASRIEESPLCQLNESVKVALGKSLSQYIKDAFQKDLFMAQVYQKNVPTMIGSRLETLSFSYFTSVSWDITMSVQSNISPGYTVSANFPFENSWKAYATCKNIFDEFFPAVQELLKQVVNHHQFAELVN